MLQPGSIVVPSSATVYAQLIEGDLFHKWQRLAPVKNESGTTLVNIPPEMNKCPGTSVVHDVQLSAVQKHEFKSLSSAIPVIEFDWSNPKIPYKRNIQSIIKPENSGKCYGIFFWWDLKMDPIGDIILSCAPKWSGNKYWRDHWIQAIYYFPQEIDVIKNQELILHTCHDEYSFWFYTNDHIITESKVIEDISKLPMIESKITSKELPIPNCNPNCGLHQSVNFTRIGNLNDPNRREKYIKSLENQVDVNTKALVTGDGTLLPLIIKKLGAKEVYTTDEALWIKQIAKYNKLDITYIKKEEMTEEFTKKLTLVCSEPYYSAAILPWYNLAFWYTRSELKLSNEVTVIPCSGTIYAMPVELEDLWKIRAPLGEVEGFKMKPFDDLIEVSRVIYSTIASYNMLLYRAYYSFYSRLPKNEINNIKNTA
jgi:protein arginine N-methyltransferase 7